jgi:hypothetical protein
MQGFLDGSRGFSAETDIVSTLGVERLTGLSKEL